LERGLGLLALRGRLGFIVPNKLFKLDFAREMRAQLSERELVDEVIDFGASQVFAEATNYTCILVLDRTGIPELAYRRIHGTRDEVLAELLAPEALSVQRFTTRSLGADPWVLVPPDEAAVIQTASNRSQRLGELAPDIFTGLQTSADDVYVLEDRGERAGFRIVWSRASSEEIELEPDLLHPLASGQDVERYGFGSLPNLLLFPYVRNGSGMRLLSPHELDRLPRTRAYLAEHETRLRGRERGTMDHDGWYAFGRTQSLGNHDVAKLGVPRLCHRLRAAFDSEGVIFLDNVDVNGILTTVASPWLLLVLLNSRLLDWIFRRASVPFQNEFWSANKQFISGLPIRVPSGAETDELEALGRRLHELACDLAEERSGFVRWLAATAGVSFRALMRRRHIASYQEASPAQVVAAVRRLDPAVDPRERATRALIEREHRASSERVLRLVTDLAAEERTADAVTYELYELPAHMRELVDSEYE
jgi:Eco57I restriction-modification methylase